MSNKRYDEDFEYYVPVRQYNKTAKKEVVEAAAVEDEEEVVEPKKKRGRAATGKFHSFLSFEFEFKFFSVQLCQ